MKCCDSHAVDIVNLLCVLLLCLTQFIMPPTLKKFGRHIGLGLFVCPSFRPSIRLCVTLALGQEPLEIGP